MDKWIRSAKAVPTLGSDVLCAWVVDGKPVLMGVAQYSGGGHWHDPEDDEDDYRIPEFWMRLPKAPV